MDELDIILGQVQGDDAVPNELKAHALEGSLIPDKNGVWPSKVGYIPTYDYYYAAMNLVVYLRSQPQVTSTSSEGTSVTTTVANWDSLMIWLKSKSAIVLASGDSVITPVSIPLGPHVVKQNMQGSGVYRGDTDNTLG